jgi:pentatricopeptide repeat protein
MAEMKGAGVPCGTSTYAALLSGYATCGGVEGGLELLKKMKAQGIRAPNKGAASRLLTASANREGIRIAKAALEKMKEAGVGYDALCMDLGLKQVATHVDGKKWRRKDLRVALKRWRLILGRLLAILRTGAVFSALRP